MKSKILIQIALLENGSITCQSTSKNKITSLGIMQAGIALMQKSILEQEESLSNIIVPEIV